MDVIMGDTPCVVGPLLPQRVDFMYVTMGGYPPESQYMKGSRGLLEVAG